MKDCQIIRDKDTPGKKRRLTGRGREKLWNEKREKGRREERSKQRVRKIKKVIQGKEKDERKEERE